MHMGWFDAISVGNLDGKIINPEPGRPAKSESLSCKSYTVIVRPRSCLGRREYLCKRFPVQPT